MQRTTACEAMRFINAYGDEGDETTEPKDAQLQISHYKICGTNLKTQRMGFV